MSDNVDGDLKDSTKPLSNISKFDPTDGGQKLVGSSAAFEDDETYRYRMNHKRRGQFLIINNKNFHSVTNQKVRTGTDVDAQNLEIGFKNLGFDVTVKHDQTCAEMLKLMIQAGKDDHSDEDCFGVAVLSHGDHSIVFGADGIIYIDKLVEPIKSCRTLAGKPKIFIIQACRGNLLDPGIEATDGVAATTVPTRRIPIEADIIYAFSTTPGYYAWRNSDKGSWFVQAIHRMMQRYGPRMDFLRLMTRVCYEVAHEFESNAENERMSKKKQAPSIVTSLTKDLYFM